MGIWQLNGPFWGVQNRGQNMSLLCTIWGHFGGIWATPYLGWSSMWHDPRRPKRGLQWPWLVNGGVPNRASWGTPYLGPPGPIRDSTWQKGSFWGSQKGYQNWAPNGPNTPDTPLWGCHQEPPFWGVPRGWAQEGPPDTPNMGIWPDPQDRAPGEGPKWPFQSRSDLDESGLNPEGAFWRGSKGDPDWGPIWGQNGVILGGP
jgi:hypothetical protein